MNQYMRGGNNMKCTCKLKVIISMLVLFYIYLGHNCASAQTHSGVPAGWGSTDEKLTYQRIIHAMGQTLEETPFFLKANNSLEVRNESLMKVSGFTMASISDIYTTYTSSNTPPPKPKDVAMLGLAQRLLGKLTTDAATVYGATITNIANLKVQEAANVFNNDDIRGRYDKLKSITNVVGPLLFAGATYFAAKDDREGANFTGGLAALSVLAVPITKLFDKKPANNAGQKAVTEVNRSIKILQQIDLSRRAYDDIKIQNKLYETYRNRASQRLGQLKVREKESGALLQKIQKGSPVQASEVKEFIQLMMSDVGEYEILSEFFEDFTNQLLGQVQYYRSSYPALDYQFELISSEIEKVITGYETNVKKPFLAEIPKLKKQLIQWLISS